jgi:hypothetical protein
MRAQCIYTVDFGALKEALHECGFLIPPGRKVKRGELKHGL